MNKLNIKIYFETNKLDTAKKVFNKFTKEKNIDLNIIENLRFNIHHSSFIEAFFSITSRALNQAELVFDAISTMENFTYYGFYFSGSSQENFKLISNNVGGAMGGISTIFLEADSSSFNMSHK